MSNLIVTTDVGTTAASQPPIGRYRRVPVQVHRADPRAPQVAGRLIATGHSNRAIAQALFISPNTVLRHVSNIFTKTGVANRAEAAAYATRHGLTE